jgi:FHS family L-fucose permease-like MFS transporter
MSTSKTGSAVSGFTAALVLTLSLFALWGMGQQLSGVLLPKIAEPLHLKGYEVTLSQYIAGIVYVICALPAAFYATRLGYKAAVLFGLGCITLGCFTLYSTLAIHAHDYFFLAATIMALGWVFLDVAANPLAASLGPDDKFVWRINLAQAIFPVGTIVAIISEKWLLGPHEIWGARFTLSAAHPLALLGAGVWLIAWVFDEKRFPAVAIERAPLDMGGTLRSLLSDWGILLAMAAQGAGIIILIANGSIGGHYLVAAFGVDEVGPLGNVFFWAALIFAAGRLVGCGLMRFVSPARLLAIFAIAGCACSLIAAMGSILISGVAVLAIQFFASIIWPTILGLAIRGRGPMMKVATALVCMGGAIGANLYVLMFLVSPSLPGKMGMLLPTVCFVAIAGFALVFRRQNTTAPAGAVAPEPQMV